MSCITLLLLLVMAYSVSASHFYGGVMTFTPKGRNPDGSFRVDFRFKETYHGCYYLYDFWHCFNGNCGYSSRFLHTQVDQSTFGDSWCQAEGYVSRNIQSNKPFELRQASCCWIQSVYGYMSWSLLTHIDLGIRSDTSEPNRSPVTTIIPLLRVAQNCPRRFNLLAHDPDEDQVRCRYGIMIDSECGGCYQYGGFHLDQNSCTLSYISSSSYGAHTFELVLEDFPTRHITLSYTDGTYSVKSPISSRRNRRSSSFSTTNSSSFPWWSLNGTQATNSTISPPTTTSTSTSTKKMTITTVSVPQWWNVPISPTTTPSPWWWNQQTTTSPAWWQKPGLPTTTVPPFWWTTTTQATTTTNWWQYSTTTTPPTGPSLSKIPLQFSVQVNPPVPSCTEGEYMPKFLSPTPSDGAYIQAAVNKELVIRIKAMVTYAAFNNFFISGPSNITKQTTINGTTGQSVIRWTPTTNDFGDHLPICFVAESIYSYSAYHSEMRCVIVVVGHTFGKARVLCSDRTMTVEVEKSSIIGLHENHLRLNDPSCTLTSNSTHVLGTISLNSCGTQVEEDSEKIIFKNQITSFENDSKAVITRKHEVEIGFSCAYPKKGQVSFQFKAHKIPYVFTEKGFGQFTYQFEFFHSELYTRMVDPNTYPVEVNLKEMIYMKIKATTSLNNTQLFVESCKATPYDDPNYHVFYSIIENGCTVDDTIVVYPSSQTEYKFAMEAFKFIGMHDEVYISCSVILCRAGDPSTRCAQGCVSPTSGPVGHHYVKRSVTTETSPHYISQGPLRLKRSPFSAVTGINLNMNLVFIAGTLLVAVALACGVLIYKTKRTTVKYQALPSSDF